MVLSFGKLLNVFEILFICTDEPQEKVGILAFGSLVVTKFLIWMPLPVPSMDSFFFFVKLVFEIKEDDILMQKYKFGWLWLMLMGLVLLCLQGSSLRRRVKYFSSGCSC